MIVELIFAFGATVAGCAAIMSLPRFLAARRNSFEVVSRLSDEFSSHVDILVKSRNLSDEVEHFLYWIGSQFGSPKLVRTIFVLGLTGKIAAHAKSPSAQAREFRKQLDELPERTQKQLASAIAIAFAASAESSIVWGPLFKRLMLPDPRQQSDTAAVYASEIAQARMLVAA